MLMMNLKVPLTNPKIKEMMWKNLRASLKVSQENPKVTATNPKTMMERIKVVLTKSEVLMKWG